MRQFVTFLLLIFTALSALAQSAAKADALFENGDYTGAFTIYEALVGKSPKNLLYNYRMARCLQETSRPAEALPYFARTGQKYVLTYFFTAECYMALWQPDEAIEAYNTFLSKEPKSQRRDYIERQIQKARMWQRYLKRVQTIEMVDSVIVHKNNLLSGYVISEETGVLAMDSVGLTSYTNQRGDRCLYAVPTDSLSRLFSRYRLLNSWSAAEALPLTVNFTAQQNFPFSMSDGVTTYFAACDSSGFGGWDIYVTRYNSATNTYTKPENIGLPFNSDANDYLFVVDEKRGIGFFATDRFRPADSVCVYQFLWREQPVFYCADMPSDTLALLARLKAYPRTSKPVLIPSTDTHHVEDNNRQETAFRLVISPEKVYVREKDFRTKEALELFQRYRQQAAELNRLEQQLRSQREAFHLAEKHNRDSMAQQIEQLENRQDVLAQRQKQLLNRIQQLETQSEKTEQK